VPRARLLLLFADCDEARARQRLSRLLYELRRVLAAGASALQTHGDTLSLDCSGCHIDLTAFALAAHSYDSNQLSAGLALYRGPLLDGFALTDAPEFEQWCEQERARFDLLHQELLTRLIGVERKRGNWQSVAEHAQTLIICDPLREDAHLALMEALMACGQRGAMLRQYDTLCEVLRRELDAEPLPETQERYAQLRTLAAPPNPLPPVAPPDLPQLGLVLPFVGREAELTILQVQTAQVRAGARRLVVVNGVSGVGKTSLAEAALPVIISAGFNLLRLTCYATPPPAPYQALADALSMALEPEANPFTRWRAEGAASATDAERALWEQLVVAMRRAAHPQHPNAPLALLIDDIQWADGALLQALPNLIRRLAQSPLLVVVLCRSDEQREPVTETLRTLSRELPSAEWIELQPLEHTVVATLTRLALGEAGTHLTARLYAETEGNALFLTEMLRDLQERSARGGALEINALPHGVRAAIGAHLARLPKTALLVAEAAAVSGREVEFDLLRQVVSMSEEALVQVLEQLERNRVLAPSAGGLTFTHGKLQELLYDTLSSVRRRQLHRRYARALSKSQRAGANAMLLDHARRAYDWELAFTAARQAAAAARRLAALHDALAFESQALAALDQLAPNPTHRLAVLLDQEEDAYRLGQQATQATLLDQLDALAPMVGSEADLLYRRGRYLDSGGAAVEGRRLLEQAAAAAPRAELRQAAFLVLVRSLAREGQVAAVHELGERLHGESTSPPARLAVCLTMAEAMQALEDLEATRRWLELARPLAHTQVGAQARIWQMIARNELRRGDVGTMLQFAARARASYTAQGERAREAECLILEGIALSRQARYGEASATFEQALAINSQLGNPYGQATASLNLAVQQSRLGDHDAAVEGFRAAWRRYGELGDAHGEVISSANLAVVESLRGNPQVGAEAARAALVLAKTLAIPFLEASALSALSTALLLQGDAEGAYTARQRSLAMRDTEEIGYTNDLAFQSLNCLALGRLDEAEALSSEAIQRFDLRPLIEKPQTIFAIRALVAHRCGNHAVAEHSLCAAEHMLQQVLAGMPSTKDRRRYLARTPVNRFIRAARAGNWDNILPL
jgi:DNA-binding SARP family transcriptional activator/chloramphenicol 3-O-phosphotransferase